MDQNLSGRCFCGAITWRSPGPVLWAGHCHCEGCRRATSAPFTSFFGVNRAGVTWHGALKWRHTSQGRVSRGFCGDCGSQMAYQFSGWPDETHLYAASLDDPQAFDPQAHYHYAEKLAWVHVQDDLVKHPGSADTITP